MRDFEKKLKFCYKWETLKIYKVVLDRRDIEKTRCSNSIEKIENSEDYSSSLEVFKKKVKGP